MIVFSDAWCDKLENIWSASRASRVNFANFTFVVHFPYPLSFPHQHHFETMAFRHIARRAISTIVDNAKVPELKAIESSAKLQRAFFYGV